MSLAARKVGFFTVATNGYSRLVEQQLYSISKQISRLDWHFVIASDQVDELQSFAHNLGLENNIKVIECLPFRFPLASMLRFKYLSTEMKGYDFICYVDADMIIENPDCLHNAITKSDSVNLVLHPGWTRTFKLRLSLKEQIHELLTRLAMGGLGTWETKARSHARVPRGDRVRYFAGGLFFGPSDKILEMSLQCDNWMDTDLRAGLIARVHDESYLNRWASLNEVTALGPEFCYFDFPWLPEMEVVVRAVDKTNLNLD